MIIACADAVVDSALQGWGSDQSSFPPEVRAAYIAALQDPATVHAICEEYRAAATLDFTQDIKDRHANHRIACPILALWGKGGPVDSWYEEAGGPLGIWRNWADAVSGRAIEGGHFFPEHNGIFPRLETRVLGKFSATGAWPSVNRCLCL
jgi:haloacetate dehalogenase